MEDKKREILNFFKGIKLNETSHQYSFKNTNINSSVSSIVKKFVEPFDTKNISKKVALKRGITTQEVLDEWNTIKEEACKRGTETHLFGENYPFNKYLKPKNNFEKAIIKFWEELPFNVVSVLTELQMFHKTFLFAGTADILLYDEIDNTFIIADLKTNKDLFKNYKNKKLLEPFDNLLDSPYNQYQLQLSFYHILFEQLNLKVSSRKIVWLKPDGNYELYDTKDYTEILKKYLKNNSYV